MITRHTLAGEHLRLAYDHLEVCADLTVAVPPERITVVVGANACGKSTLLRALARLLKPAGGVVLLDGEDIHRLPTREVATRLGILPQSPIAPEGITVADLVSRGTLELSSRPVDELSGGQRQRVWIAMTLAQGTGLMLLDEPTTFLDLAHQVDVLDLLVDLNQREGRTIVLVLHDLNQACRYAHHLIAMRDGAIVAEGAPGEVVTADLVERVFGLRCRVIIDPVSSTPLVLPIGRHVNVTEEEADAAVTSTA